jgi:hypothetical protein
VIAEQFGVGIDEKLIAPVKFVRQLVTAVHS